MHLETGRKNTVMTSKPITPVKHDGAPASKKPKVFKKLKAGRLCIDLTSEKPTVVVLVDSGDSLTLLPHDSLGALSASKTDYDSQTLSSAWTSQFTDVGHEPLSRFAYEYHSDGVRLTRPNYSS